MLELDSERRITAVQALSHPYLAQYADPSDEPDSEPYDQSFEDMELPTEKWKGEQNFWREADLVTWLLAMIENFFDIHIVKNKLAW